MPSQKFLNFFVVNKDKKSERRAGLANTKFISILPIKCIVLLRHAPLICLHTYILP